ncbi:uncharacterized protein ASPGLDRAFT_28158 [Aspergillus glaucus CBS 516.65]|uniref:Uncharacterized protein n=1 Tax=Aspergillus glaucus CBS 516.65 TaxID=1160497 RepID=A0A1L9VBK8_ASPGL|nr:hypothetical protein ASPGLDRAFT_28158 [Aspergillus glaucus CBS 516.65]OJJ81321.1 hypothetical protein ASPGLDRAFT_28158 [Aspergillus glaucus CBS 516.65]
MDPLSDLPSFPDPTTLRPDNPNIFTGEQEKRTVYLPPSIALDKATLPSILHDHLVLAQAVWPDYTPVENLHPAPNTTIRISRQDITTLTSLHDGVAILHVLEYGDSVAAISNPVSSRRGALIIFE